MRRHKLTMRMYVVVFLALCQSACCLGAIVLHNVGMEVANGRMEYVGGHHLRFRRNPGETCKVEVTRNEPMYQRVGTFTPEIFDCDYLPNTVRYEHNGSPFLHEDVVKMRAYVLESNRTLQETVYFRVSILNSRCDIITLNGVSLSVPRNSRVSNPITRDVVEFDYDRKFDTECEVRVLQHTVHPFPSHGQLVAPDNSSAPREWHRDARFKVITSVKQPCDRFVLMGIRYEHLTPPTPDVDYIPIHVIVTDRRSGSILQQERHWLPVTIESAYPNQPPKPSLGNMYILEVDQFVLTNLLPMTVSATDGETSNRRLIYSISRQPAQGYITHLSDHSKAIDSFWQQDVDELQIAYQPPNASFPERRTFEVEFEVFDAYFLKSQPITVLLSVRVASTNAPIVSWNMGLTMLEGQTRAITTDCLQVVDKDSLNRVRFTLSGGLQRGRLYVGQRPGFMFSWNDVLDGVVTYRHDDTDSRKDFVSFRLTDGFHSVRFKVPISILPKDDAPPFLINNIVFQVQEGQVILIHRFMLEASDADSYADYIRFNITTPPSAGEIQKRRKWDRGGWSVDTFQQTDLYKGLIHYKHLGGELFEDFFEFVLIDSCKPHPNVSPIQRVTIKITPVDDLPPQPGPGNSLTLTVNETDVVHLTREQLHYIDVEKENSDVTYTITSPCQRIDFERVNDDAGHLIFTDDMVMLMKDPSVPVLRTFTQTAVNHLKVAYMPPMEDVGLHPVDVQFSFSVAEAGGKKLPAKRFAITILPVDNQIPQIQTTEMCLNEGGTEILLPDVILVQDEDTIINELKMFVSAAPKFGKLVKNNVLLNRGDKFDMNDINLFSVAYVHDGSENHLDEFEITVSDGKQNSSAIMPIKMQPVDDERPTFNHGNQTLRVPEGGSVAFTSTFLSATDVDTDNGDLIFEVLSLPQHGQITMNNQPVTTFMQQHILLRQVFYTHDGREIGKSPISDEVTIMVSDRRGKRPERNEVLQTSTLQFLILPVNSQPPLIALGHSVFACNESGLSTLTNRNIMADDMDTPVDQLSFVITSKPHFGFIQDVTPRPGYEKVLGKETSAFNYTQLQSGYIQYVQSQHHGIEPTSDEFVICSTDGQFQSAEVPFLIAINPQNDEEPIFTYENISCTEGSMQPLTLSIEDIDVPHDHVIIRITKPPDHGMVMDEMQMLDRHRRSSNARFHAIHHTADDDHHDMHPLDEFSMDLLHRNKVLPAYMHDGSENQLDEFEIRISDGKHIIRKMMMVHVEAINDEQPIVQINDELSLELGEAKVISGRYLHTSDADTPSADILYELHSIPKRGSLQLKNDINGAWNNLQYADRFSEEDVEMNRIRYNHESVLGSKSQDSFRFSVTDGEFTTNRQNFIIRIQHAKKKAIHIVTHPLHVNESEKVFITTDNLIARDDSNRPEDITYNIIHAPTFGRIEHVNFPNVPIDMFTQLDLLATNIIYLHTSKADSPIDSFRVLANNGVREKEADITILITPVDSALPVLSMSGDSIASQDQPSSNLMLYSGSSVVIGKMVISISDEDTPKENLKLVVVDFPIHGVLKLNGVELDENNNVVLQTDIEGAHFVYQHSGDNSNIDRFYFTVTDGVHMNYQHNGRVMQSSTPLHIKIDELDETPPQIVANSQASKIKPLGKGKSYTIHIEESDLRATDTGTSNTADITYIVTQYPSYGHLKVSGLSNDGPIDRFTQSDINTRKVFYIIAAKLKVTNDSFAFQVEDGWGNMSPEQRFSMAWSRIKLNQTKLRTCENSGVVSIGITRYGNLISSSFVSAMSKPASAKQAVDFNIISASQIQFDPMRSVQEWRFAPIMDGIEERKEKFKLVLHTPVNAVIAPRHKLCKITLMDATSRKCSNSKKSRGGKKKSTKRRKQKKKQKKPRKEKQLQDAPAPVSPNLVRYGKLGPGATVEPSSFFRNNSVRIWTYHALLPVTVDEAEEHSIGQAFVNAQNVQNVPTQINSNEEEINDDPSVATSHNILYKGRFDVENSNASVNVIVRSQNTITSSSLSTHKPRKHRPATISAQLHSQRCTLMNEGTKLYDIATSKMFVCDGAQWVKWKKKRKGSSPTKRKCPKGWQTFDNMCYFVGTIPASWNSAQRICRERYSSQLVSVHSRKQLNWLWKIANKQPFLIGLNRKLDPNSWEWIDGSAVTFTNWKRKYPKQHSSSTNCAMVQSKKRWIDCSCTSTIGNTKYICMKE